MRIVVITDSEFLPREAEALTALLDAGAWRVHVRKPGSDVRSMMRLLEAFPERYHRYISLHDHHELALDLGIGGVHLSSRNPLFPRGFTGLVSRSCHSFEELGRYAGQCDYMFLSPVFDSISKQGYRSQFPLEEISRRSAGQSVAADSEEWLRCRRELSGGVIPRAADCTQVDWTMVFALGGVCPDNVPLVRDAGFGGAAVLGYLWEQYRINTDLDALVSRLRCLVPAEQADVNGFKRI